MSSEEYWNIFVNTGSVDSYLLYRAGETGEQKNDGTHQNSGTDSKGLQFE